MDRWGVHIAVIMPPPVPEERSDETYLDGLLSIAKGHPDRFVVAGGGASLNGMIQSTAAGSVSAEERTRFIQRAEEIIRKGAVGFGEFTALHFSFFKNHPFEETQPDHPLFLLLADIAAAHNVPLDLHIEAVTAPWLVSQRVRRRSTQNPTQVDENISAFERLLAHNRNAKIIWVHLGMDTTGHRTVALTRRLLTENPNLYLSITGNIAVTQRNGLFENGVGLNPEWQRLMLQFPDRFMIGTDTFFQPDAPNRQVPHRGHVAIEVLRMLPAGVRAQGGFRERAASFRTGCAEEGGGSSRRGAWPIGIHGEEEAGH